MKFTESGISEPLPNLNHYQIWWSWKGASGLLSYLFVYAPSVIAYMMYAASLTTIVREGIWSVIPQTFEIC